MAIKMYHILCKNTVFIENYSPNYHKKELTLFLQVKVRGQQTSKTAISLFQSTDHKITVYDFCY